MNTLWQKYDHFNRLLFHGELPVVTLKYVPALPVKSGSQSAGRTLWKYRTRSTGYETVSGSIVVEISRLFDRTQQQQDGILVHEMIHVHFAHHNDVDQNHGPLFLAMVRDFSGRLGFDIPLTDETDDLSYASDIGGPDVGVLLINRPTGESMLSVFAPGLFDNYEHLAKLTGFFGRHLGEPAFRNEYVFLRGKTVVARQFRINRTVTKQFRIYRINLRDKNEIFETCRELERLDGRLHNPAAQPA